MFNWINQGLGYIIKFCYSLTNNYALALLLFAFLIKLLLFPLGIKQQKNMVKQAKLRPREMAIRKKYAGRNDQATQQKMQQEVMNLYQEENFNPMGGCLPLLIQLPILFALYEVIRKPLTYICNFSKETIEALSTKVAEITASEAINIQEEVKIVNEVIKSGVENYEGIAGFSAELIPDFTIFGGTFNLANTPSFKEFSWLLLIPVLTFLFTVFSSKITKKLSYQAPSTQDAANNPSMKIMEYSMPLLSTYICFVVPAAIGVYWIYQNILSVLQTVIMAKLYPIPSFTEEDYKAAEKAVGAAKKAKKAADPNKPKVRSLHHIDDDEYEEIYGKKADNAKKSAKNEKKTEEKPEVTEEKKEEAPADAPEEKPTDDSDIPKLKDDKTKYKKKD